MYFTDPKLQVPEVHILARTTQIGAINQTVAALHKSPTARDFGKEKKKLVPVKERPKAGTVHTWGLLQTSGEGGEGDGLTDSHDIQLLELLHCVPPFVGIRENRKEGQGQVNAAACG